MVTVVKRNNQTPATSVGEPITARRRFRIRQQRRHGLLGFMGLLPRVDHGDSSFVSHTIGAVRVLMMKKMKMIMIMRKIKLY